MPKSHQDRLGESNENDDHDDRPKLVWHPEKRQALFRDFKPSTPGILAGQKDRLPIATIFCLGHGVPLKSTSAPTPKKNTRNSSNYSPVDFPVLLA